MKKHRRQRSKNEVHLDDLANEKLSEPIVDAIDKKTSGRRLFSVTLLIREGITTIVGEANLPSKKAIAVIAASVPIIWAVLNHTFPQLQSLLDFIASQVK
jgi:hypothetical protein